MVFSLSLAVDVLLLTFRYGCAFTAEVIIILFIFRGGLVSAYYASPALASAMSNQAQHALPNSRLNFIGTYMAVALPLLVMQIFSLWF